MKTIYLSLAFIILSGFSVALNAQQARFDQATYLLEQNEYREAIQLYKSIADDGYESGSLWLNLGISYTYLDSLGTAKFYFLQAEQYSETKTQAQNALSYVNERFNRRSAVLSQLPWDRFFESLSQKAGVTFLYVLAFIFLYTGAGAIIFSWFKKKFKLFLRTTGIGSIIISILFFCCTFYLQYLDNRYGTGVLVDDETSVYEQPQEDSAVVSSAYEGYTLRVDFYDSRDEPGWNYVRLENGMYGWIKTNHIQVF